jgi:ligand-binding SRPBCC domain-containing protein
VLTAEQWFPRPIEELFAFFADAHKLDELTPPWLRFAIVTPRPIDMHLGTLIDYRIRLKGLPMRWRTRISAWDPPHRFADEQLKGPYALWLHEHVFEPSDGGTLMRDTVTYALPVAWIPGAGLVHARMVRPDLARIFAYRREAMARKFG